MKGGELVDTTNALVESLKKRSSHSPNGGVLQPFDITPTSSSFLALDLHAACRMPPTVPAILGCQIENPPLVKLYTWHLVPDYANIGLLAGD